MQSAIDQAHRPATAIDLAQLRFTAEEVDAVRRGLTIVLTTEHRAGPEARSEAG